VVSAAETPDRRIVLPFGQALVGALAVAILAACSDNGGSTNIEVPPLQITTATTGSDLDPDGYGATIDGGAPIAIGINDTLIVGDAGAGQHVLGLSGIASNCRLEGSGNDTVTVVADSTITAGFTVTCSAPQTGSIAKWTAAPQPNNAPLYDTWGSGPTDFFAAGTDLNAAQAGVIDHYDGSGWVEQIRFPTIQIDAVWGTGPHDVYAAGGHNDTRAGALLHFDGMQWSEITGPSVSAAAGDTLILWQSVWGLSARDIYLVGAAYGTGFTPLVAHFDGQAWSLFALPVTTAREPLDIWGTSPQNLYVVGVLHGAPDPKNANDQGLILHYNGSGWDETIRPEMGVHLKAVWGASADNIYVVGDPGVVAHWDGGTWKDEPRLITTALHEIWGTSSDNVYAVAARGHILRFDGTQWSEMSRPTDHDLFGIWGSASDDAWVVGNDGVILHGTP
jgi:hypothetical protein